jgi:16S rRNA (guanine(966)-N(2))-methyltransferase RsmD
MRVIAGKFRSRTLWAPPGLQIRPTSDSLRETLFNVLGPAVSGSIFVDCYAGTGAVGIEALSRGAEHVFFIERSVKAMAAIHKNLQALDAAAQATILQGPAAREFERLARELGSRGADFFFLDPPYERAEDYGWLLTELASYPQIVTSKTIVIAEHARQAALKAVYGDLRQTREIRQGGSVLSLFGRQSGAAGDAL